MRSSGTIASPTTRVASRVPRDSRRQAALRSLARSRSPMQCRTSRWCSRCAMLRKTPSCAALSWRPSRLAARRGARRTPRPQQRLAGTRTTGGPRALPMSGLTTGPESAPHRSESASARGVHHPTEHRRQVAGGAGRARLQRSTSSSQRGEAPCPPRGTPTPRDRASLGARPRTAWAAAAARPL